MSILVNGQKATQVSALDRGLLYGQCVFETIAVVDGQAALLDLHLARLYSGAKLLSIPVEKDLLVSEIHCLSDGITKSVLRVTLSMGEGGRGYLNPSQPQATRIVSLHDYPEHPSKHWQQGIELGMVDIRLAHQPVLAGVKHGNRLEQVIARSQWQPNWQEALLLDVDQNVIEGTQSNVFLVKGDHLLTPDLEFAGVAGVMRDFIIAQADSIGVTTDTVSLSVADIELADAVFMTNSVIGLWPVKRFQENTYSDLRIPHKLLNLIIKNGAIPTI